ncbi:MAG: hypothetical protein R2684_16695 [Pyrinomonadaceae bacterium]
MLIRKLVTPTTFALLMFLLPISILAQDDAKKDGIAEIFNQSSSVGWRINIPYQSVTLTVVSPNGEVTRTTFGQGQVPTFTPVANRGEAFANGIFKYELVFEPVLPGDIKARLEQSRIDGDSEEVFADLKKRGLLPEQQKDNGTFFVQNGTIITGDSTSVEVEKTAEVADAKTNTPSTRSPKTPSATPDELLVNEDLIVLGSICTGIDCSSTESFGADTIRLKENNLRIHFEDTSNSGAFPTNDWRITINDSANGGASFFSIDDVSAGRTPFRIAAGARSDALIVDSNGRVGLGTATPATDLQVVNGNTPTLRLEQNSSGGFQARSWDIGANEVNFFVRDLNNDALPLRIAAGAQASTLYLAPSGRVGIGMNTNSTVNLANQFEVQNSGTSLFRVETNGNTVSTGSVKASATGFIFPDGSIQSTAATGGGGGGGGSVLGASYAQHLFGGGGFIASFSTIAPTTDYNSFAIGTGGAAGFLTSTQNIPYNSNLSSTTGSYVVYKIRYRDSDGTGTASQVLVEIVARAVDSAAQTRTTVFNSNTEAGTGFQTVTVCKAFDTTNFNSALRSMHMNVTLIGTAANSADFAQIQIYKSATCP